MTALNGSHNVRFVSKADIVRGDPDVRFISNSGHRKSIDKYAYFSEITAARTFAASSTSCLLTSRCVTARMRVSPSVPMRTP